MQWRIILSLIQTNMKKKERNNSICLKSSLNLINYQILQ